MTYRWCLLLNDQPRRLAKLLVQPAGRCQWSQSTDPSSQPPGQTLMIRHSRVKIRIDDKHRVTQCVIERAVEALRKVMGRAREILAGTIWLEQTHAATRERRTCSRQDRTHLMPKRGDTSFSRRIATSASASAFGHVSGLSLSNGGASKQAIMLLATSPGCFSLLLERGGSVRPARRP